MKRTRLRQLDLVFADSPKGSSGSGTMDDSKGRTYLLHKAKSKKTEYLTTRATGSDRLLEEVASESNLATALLNVARNKGAPGADGCSVREVVLNAERLLLILHHELLNGRYQPGDIRRVWIPKPGGGQRGLGIPNVIDRWVQQAMLQVLEPIFEPIFHNSSHGFRPYRGAHTAIAQAKEYVTEGRMVVVDLDLAKFFDRVNHQRLLSQLEQHIGDRRILRLIRQMLKAKVVMPDGTRVSTEEGTPQGGPLSPLLSNVVLNEFDWELERRGLRFVRYADDSNIFVRSERAGRRVMATIRRFLEQRMRLQVNETKSKVARPEEVHFLGFSLELREKGTVAVHISRRTRDRLDTRIRELTPRVWGQPVAQCLSAVNEYLTGWINYFRVCTKESEFLFRRYDAHIRRRIRAIIIRQKKRPRHLFRFLVKRGVSRGAAAKTAFSSHGIWYRSNTRGMTAAFPNAWFGKRLVSLWSSWEALNSAPIRVSRQLTLIEI